MPAPPLLLKKLNQRWLLVAEELPRGLLEVADIALWRRQVHIVARVVQGRLQAQSSASPSNSRV